MSSYFRCDVSHVTSGQTLGGEHGGDFFAVLICRFSSRFLQPSSSSGLLPSVWADNNTLLALDEQWTCSEINTGKHALTRHAVIYKVPDLPITPLATA